MTTTFKCKFCGKKNEISEALAQEIEEQALTNERAKHQIELEAVKKEAEKKATVKLKIDHESAISELKNSFFEEAERNKKLLKQLSDLTSEIRALRRKDEERELEMKKKLVNEEEKIRDKAEKKAQEKYHLKDAEKDKKLNDALKANEELSRKLQQGSQQTQGEVLELELEEILKKEFPSDKIEEVKKGKRGADIIQKVIDKRNRKCGTILWEIKNAQWKNSWLNKLKEDQRQAKAQLAVLVAANPPEEIKSFTFQDGVWITNRKLAIGLAIALRFDLIHIHHEKLLSVGKNEKMEILYEYLTSTEFKHRIEAIVEAFGNLQEDIEKERRWFQTKWSRQEKELRKVIDHTQGMYGDFQGVMGRSLPEIKTLNIESGKKTEK